MKKAQYIIASAAAVALIGGVVALNLDHSAINGGKIESSMQIDNGDLKINWNNYQTYDIELSNTYTITNSGTYHFTGSLTNGSIVVKAAESDVRIILDNVTITNTSGPAIIAYAANDVVIELVGENTLEDASKYSTDLDEDITGAIYSKDDLTFQGDGTLNLVANYEDGIVAKDDLKFSSGTYNIVAVDDGIRGKDSVYIVDGSFTIESGGDAIKSTNETDAGKGFILIENGSFSLTPTAKGIKAINSILIYDGEYTINSTDDAIHSNNYVGIVGGNYAITSGDDGIHADKELVIEGGKINITKSYEGMEAQAITINAGEISIISTDDGLNAGGGADASATNRRGAGAFDADTNCVLTINGGSLYINAAGDGIDSNGYLYFNGGTVVVDGPTNNGNGALDSGASITQNGGTVIAVGASGMAETLGNDSSIYNVSIYLATTAKAGTKIEIKDASGNTIISHTAAKTFNHIAVGTPDFKSGATYTVYIDNTLYQTFTISSVTTTVGNTAQNFNSMNGMRR